MTEQEKKAALSKFLYSKGIVLDADVNAEIAKMASQLPKATAAEKGLTTDIDKAHEVMLITQGQATAPTKTQKSGGAVLPAVTMSAADTRAMNEQLKKESKDRRYNSKAASVEKLILDKPFAADYIPAGTTMIIDSDTAFNAVDAALKKPGYEFANDAAKQTYDNLKAAAANKTPVPVNTEGKSYRAAGYTINVPTDKGTEPRMMTRDQALQYITLNTDGYILSDGNKMGLKLRLTKPRRDAEGQDIPPKTILAEANKDEAKKAPLFTRVATQEKHTATVKSAQYIEIKTDKMKRDNTGYIVRKYRISGKAEIPVLQRAAEFVDVFGSGESGSSKLLDRAPEGKQLENIHMAMRYSLADMIVQSASDLEGKYADIEDRLAAFKATGPADGPKVDL